MSHITKRFPGVLALDKADIDLFKGECLALLGENGAGKSTLMKILGGIYYADEGEITLNGNPVEIPDVHTSKALGISIIHQELILVPNMTIAENIFLGQELMVNHLKGIDKKTMLEKSQNILDSFKLGIKADMKIGNLSVAQQQMVEIAKALSTKADIIVMDEPTAALTHQETEKLFSMVDELKEKGISIIYISHRMEELFRVTDRVTVMRDGKTVGTHITADVSRKELISLMVGRTLDKFFIKETNFSSETVMQVSQLTQNGVLSDISFSLKKGEILGIAGIVGAGRTELAQVIFGIHKADSGIIQKDGRNITITSPSDAIANGITLVPESRKEQGLFLQETVRYNVTIQVLKEFMQKLIFNRRREREISDRAVKQLSIRTGTDQQFVLELSGGNQQKVVISKWLATNPEILIMDEPTRGIDVGAKAEIYSIMNDLTKKGVSIIMISSDLPEILNMSDRILVMYQGMITGEINQKDATQEKVMHYATGGK